MSNKNRKHLNRLLQKAEKALSQVIKKADRESPGEYRDSSIPLIEALESRIADSKGARYGSTRHGSTAILYQHGEQPQTISPEAMLSDEIAGLQAFVDEAYQWLEGNYRPLPKEQEPVLEKAKLSPQKNNLPQRFAEYNLQSYKTLDPSQIPPGISLDKIMEVGDLHSSDRWGEPVMKLVKVTARTGIFGIEIIPNRFLHETCYDLRKYLEGICCRILYSDTKENLRPWYAYSSTTTTIEVGAPESGAEFNIHVCHENMFFYHSISLEAIFSHQLKPHVLPALLRILARTYYPPRELGMSGIL